MKDAALCSQRPETLCLEHETVKRPKNTATRDLRGAIRRFAVPEVELVALNQFVTKAPWPVNQ